MTQRDKLSRHEQVVFAAAVESSDGNGHDFGFIEDLVGPWGTVEGLTLGQTQGCIVDLEKKGLIDVHEPEFMVDHGHDVTQLVLTAAGRRLAGLENERGRTAQQELEILRMSLVRIAQALDTRDNLPGSDIQMQDRDDYGHANEVEACQQDAGWNALAASCVGMAHAMQEDIAEAWTRAKRYYALITAYENAEDEIRDARETLDRASGKLAELQGLVDASTEQTAALLDTPEGQGLKKLLED